MINAVKLTAQQHSYAVALNFKEEDTKMGITAIIRPVSSICNLSCRYCYTRLEQKHKKRLLTSADLLERVIKEFINSGHRRIEFLWHGGEPLLAGLGFFKKALKIQSKLRKELGHRIIIVNSLQTNGTLLDDKIVSFLKANGFRVGVSLDGFSEIHNLNRLTKNGNGSYELVMKGLNLFQECGINFGITSVVTKKSLQYPEEILKFFLRHRIFNIHFLPYAEIDSSKDSINDYSITAKEYNIFLNDIFEYWKAFERASKRLNILPEECKNCDYVNVCKGGCGYFKFLLPKTDKPQRDYFCAAYKGLADSMVKWLESENITIKH